ncbi:hypothetical protein GALMADRAFT_425953 [Galerina marginata CBS 339.88]|uniref:Uncharacterized protein n=1 Tax=Galerina marginata (strain CBS 339.88) TaxID=685588 RepID=A0A067T3Y7_GALM3|nr:hypothetical protein GALMADRAFT_425953 [Galerina marginata CBS 339.88]
MSDEDDSSSDSGQRQGGKQSVPMAWVDNPERDVRLLHWFDQHPIERDIVFSMGKSPTQRMEARPLLTKQECCLDAAREIFSMDEDPAVRRAVLQNPNYFAGRIKYRIFKSWRVKYTNVNWEIGAVASNIPYEGLDKKIRQSTQSFPLWKGLHVYWRTNPHFNFHYQNNLSEAGPAKRPRLSADASSSASGRNRRSANAGNIIVRKQPTRSAGRKNNLATAVQVRHHLTLYCWR